MLAHIHVMKTAGQTISGILRQSFPGNHCDLHSRAWVATAADLRLARRFYPHLASVAGHCIRPYSDLEQAGEPLRYFSFLRDPIQRCASHYQFWRTHDNLQASLAEFLSRWGGNFQTHYFSPAASADEAIETLEARVGFVGLQERFDESLELWKAWANEPQLTIAYRPRNVAADNRIKLSLLSDPAALEQLHAANEQDLRLYRYVCDVIYPRQLRQFAGGNASAAPSPRSLRSEGWLAQAKRNLLYKPLARTIFGATATRDSAA